MKGISLPINMIVIIAISVIVLLAIAAFFMGGFLRGSVTISDQQALSDGCGIWKNRGCVPDENFNITGYDWNLDNQTDDLFDACLRILGDGSTAYGSKCHDYCCKGYYTGGGATTTILGPPSP